MIRNTLLLLGSSLALLGADQKTKTPATEKSQAAQQTKTAPVPAAQAPGLVVFKDPATGELRQPTSEEIGALMAKQPLRGTAFINVMVPFQGPGNSVGIRLDDSFASYTVMTKGPDGKLVEQCVDNKDKAETLVKSGISFSKKEVLDVQ